MVNIAADMRATSDGAVKSGGRGKPSVSTTAQSAPIPAAKTMVHAPAVVAIPARHSSMSAPESTKGNARRSNRVEIASSTSNAVGSASRGKMPREKRIAAEVNAVDAAEHESELPDLFVAPARSRYR